MHTLRAHLPVNSRAAGLAGIAAESRSPARPQRLRSPAGGNPSVSRPRSVSLAASSSTTEAEVAPSLRPARAARPPDDYDYAAVFRGRSVAYCRDHFPEIVDLAEAGIVVVVERPADYVERREDGYAEPEVVVLVGTSHVSLTSVAHVERAIRAVRPNNTVVELCRSRASIMYTDESGRGADGAGAGPGGGGGSAANEFALGGGQGFTQSLQRSLRLGGAPALLIRAALAAVSRRLGAKVGAAPGGEFRAARRAALACGSQLVLGDRPLEITLSRAWAAASTRHRAEFAAFLLRGLFGAIPEVSQGDIDRVRSDDGIVRQLFVALSERYPALVRFCCNGSAAPASLNPFARLSADSAVRAP